MPLVDQQLGFHVGENNNIKVGIVNRSNRTTTQAGSKWIFLAAAEERLSRGIPVQAAP
jgi:hypothetical protein